MTRTSLVAPLFVVAFCAAGAPARAQGWMHPDVAAAHASGYQGQGVAVFVIDLFKGRAVWTKLDSWALTTHGQFDERVVRDIAPKANVFGLEATNVDSSITFTGAPLKVVNVSLGIPRRTFSDMLLGARFGSIIYAANSNLVLTVKSSGNSGVAMDGRTKKGMVDVLAPMLKPSRSVIFAGALEHNGSVGSKTTRASYSNYAGPDPVYQSRMLFVGVDKDKIIRGQGTSGAAAILSGYAAIVGSKFRNASPVEVSSQLLKTARQDTILHYDPAIYGRGEASLSRALAPVGLK